MRVQAKDVKKDDVIDGRRVTWILGIGGGRGVMRFAFDDEQRVGMARLVDEWVEVERPEKSVTITVELTEVQCAEVERLWGELGAPPDYLQAVKAKVAEAVRAARTET